MHSKLAFTSRGELEVFYGVGVRAATWIVGGSGLCLTGLHRSPGDSCRFLRGVYVALVPAGIQRLPLATSDSICPLYSLTAGEDIWCRGGIRGLPVVVECFTTEASQHVYSNLKLS